MPFACSCSLRWGRWSGHSATPPRPKTAHHWLLFFSCFSYRQHRRACHTQPPKGNDRGWRLLTPFRGRQRGSFDGGRGRTPAQPRCGSKCRLFGHGRAADFGPRGSLGIRVRTPTVGRGTVQPPSLQSTLPRRAHPPAAMVSPCGGRVPPSKRIQQTAHGGDPQSRDVASRARRRARADLRPGTVAAGPEPSSIARLCLFVWSLSEARVPV